MNVAPAGCARAASGAAAAASIGAAAARLLLVALACCGAPALAADYVPPRGEWQAREPAAAGFDPARLAAAVELARRQTVVEPQDLRRVIVEHYGPREPGYRVLGPTGTRIGGSGMVLRGGYVVAQWGDVDRPEMAFSVAKSVLATVAGVAFADGRIRSLDGRVARYVPGPAFEGEHHGAITWRHLLEQSSDWRGTLWDVPDWADRPVGATLKEWQNPPKVAPGTVYEYNDVRVNLLALSLLEVLREPLPRVLRSRVMDPIGASAAWRWHGYENSWVEVDGTKVQSVSGGGHFGGGMFVSTADLARFGLLMERDGRWGRASVVRPEWIAAMTTPSKPNPEYGLLWWLNADRKAIPAAPASAFWAAGFGGNCVYVDREHDLVVVLRWVPQYAEVVGAIVESLHR